MISGLASCIELTVWYNVDSASFEFALGGMYTAVILMAENSLGKYTGRHLTVKNSMSSEQWLAMTFTLVHQLLLMKMQTPPPLRFPLRA